MWSALKKGRRRDQEEIKVVLTLAPVCEGLRCEGEVLDCGMVSTLHFHFSSIPRASLFITSELFSTIVLMRFDVLYLLIKVTVERFIDERQNLMLI